MAINLGDATSRLGLDLNDPLNQAGNLAAAYAAYDLPEKGIKKLEQAQSTLIPKITQLGQDVSQTAQFKPFSVRTGTGTANIGAQGGLDTSVSGPLAQLSAQLQSQAGTMAQQAPVTSQSLFEQLQAMSQPEQERQQLALENRLAAQGRLGVNTAAYGGTPEQLAMQKAIQEQQSANMFQALQLAPQLQAQQTSNIAGLLGTSFAPEQQQFAGLQAASPFAQLAQAARQGQTEAQANIGTAGIASEAELFNAIAGLESARAGALADALQGLFASNVTIES